MKVQTKTIWSHTVPANLVFRGIWARKHAHIMGLPHTRRVAWEVSRKGGRDVVWQRYSSCRTSCSSSCPPLPILSVFWARAKVRYISHTSECIKYTFRLKNYLNNWYNATFLIRKIDNIGLVTTKNYMSLYFPSLP